MTTVTPKIFIKHLKTTEFDLNTISQGIGILDSDLNTAVQFLSYPSDVADDLNSVYEAISTVLDVLLLAELIPDVGEFIPEIRKPLKAFKELVNEVRKPVNKLAHAVKPYKDAVQKVEERVNKSLNWIDTAESNVTRFTTDFSNVYHCVNSLSSGTLKTNSETFLNEFVATANTAVVDVNDVMSLIISEGETIATALEDAAHILQKDVAPIRKAIRDFLSDFSPFFVALKAIQNGLDHKITVPDGIKITGPWYDPFDYHIHIEYFTFTVEEIIKGIDDIISAVEDLLIDAVKVFTGPLLDDLKKEFNKIAQEITIPGLSKLEGYLDRFSKDIINIEKSFQLVFTHLNKLSNSLQQYDTEVRKDFLGLVKKLEKIPCVQQLHLT